MTTSDACEEKTTHLDFCLLLLLLLLLNGLRQFGGYADDVAQLTTFGTPAALSKTEVVVLTKKKFLAILPLRVGDATVETKPVIDYVDELLRADRRARDKAVNGVTPLSRPISNVVGPKCPRCRSVADALEKNVLPEA